MLVHESVLNPYCTLPRELSFFWSVTTEGGRLMISNDQLVAFVSLSILVHHKLPCDAVYVIIPSTPSAILLCSPVPQAST